jgi:plasmid stabilization system protein ParE
MPSWVRITGNFQRNLEQIREYLIEQEFATGFDDLIEQLFENVIPNLERFPDMGRDFLARNPLSVEGQAKRHALKVKSGANTAIREYIADDYLLLYAVRDSVVFLLSIRHHRQLSFDLRTHWH